MGEEIYVYHFPLHKKSRDTPLYILGGIMIGFIILGFLTAKREVGKRTWLEKNYPKQSKLEIISKDLNMNDSTETILYDKSKNKNYLVKYDSTGNLNLVPYKEEK